MQLGLGKGGGSSGFEELAMELQGGGFQFCSERL
jgi:hypothetical protein